MVRVHLSPLRITSWNVPWKLHTEQIFMQVWFHLRSCTARYETTSRHWILDKRESKTSVDLEFNKTMYLLKRFNTDTLVSVKLKRTNISYQKLNWIGSLAEMLRISHSWCAFHGNAPHKASVTVSKLARCLTPCGIPNSIMVKFTKGAGRMPWHQEPKKDVISCEKLRGGANIH